MKIPTEVVSGVCPFDLSTRTVAKEFRKLVEDGAKLQIAGVAKKNPSLLEQKIVKPKFGIDLFDTTFFLSGVIQIPELRFFVGYVVQQSSPRRKSIYPRIFYKDLSLAWRSASHFAFEDDGDLWIGKGDVRYEVESGSVMVESIESTTDLPIEIQSSLESLLKKSGKAAKGNLEILSWILRQGPSDRVEPYDDFVKPRELAAALPENLVNRGRSIACFKSTGDPTSLWIAKGFEPDFKNGVIERSQSQSRLYGGRLQRFRILSTNQKIQYYFIAGPDHVWIIPPQATTTELSSFGVRTIDVIADDDLFIPGYEYHHDFETANGIELYSQIPDGFAGEVCPHDEAKADASPWLNKIPLIQEFRRRILGQKVST
jgi:hypothetical protein